MTPTPERIKELKELRRIRERLIEMRSLTRDEGDFLIPILSDYEKLKAENERLLEASEANHLGKVEWATRAEKAEAEVQHRCDQRDAALESVGLLTAKLERVRPLIEAAMADKYDLYGYEDKVLCAALALRQSKEKGEKNERP